MHIINIVKARDVQLKVLDIFSFAVSEVTNS